MGSRIAYTTRFIVTLLADFQNYHQNLVVLFATVKFFPPKWVIKLFYLINSSDRNTY